MRLNFSRCASRGWCTVICLTLSDSMIAAVSLLLQHYSCSPGHFLLLHGASWILSPSQSCPPFAGAGLLQNRCLVFFSSPHTLVHLVHFDHTPHRPLRTCFAKTWSRRFHFSPVVFCLQQKFALQYIYCLLYLFSTQVKIDKTVLVTWSTYRPHWRKYSGSRKLAILLFVSSWYYFGARGHCFCCFFCCYLK